MKNITKNSFCPLPLPFFWARLISKKALKKVDTKGGEVLYLIGIFFACFFSNPLTSLAQGTDTDQEENWEEDLGIEVEYAADAVESEDSEDSEEIIEQDTDDASNVDEPKDRVVNFKGRIIEKGSRKPVADITVYLKDTEHTAITDNNGVFEFYNLEPHNYQIVIPSTAYETFETDEKINEKELLAVKYYLAPKVYGGLEVVVRDKKVEKEVSRTVLKIEEAKYVPGTGGDPVKAIESMPGVARGGGGGGGEGLVIRGSNAGDSKVYLDGHEIPSLFHFGGLKSLYNSELLNEFQLYTGGFTSQYGLATGGVVSLESSKPRLDRWGGYADLSMIDGSAMVEGPLTENMGLAVAARRSTTDLLMNAINLNDKIDGFNFTTYPVYYDYQLKWNYQINDRHSVSFDFYGGYDGMAFNMDSVSDDEPGMTGHGQSSWSFQNMFPHWRYDNGIIESDFSPGYMHIIEEFKMGEYFIADTVHILDVNEDLRIKMGKHNTLAVGARVTPRWIDIQSNFVRPPKEGDVGFSFANAEPVVTNQKESDVITSAYVQNEMQLGPVLFIPGVRFDHESSLNAYAFGPRGSVRWQVVDPFVLKTSGGLYSRIPDPDELIEPFGDKNLKLEQAAHAVAGFEWNITDALELDVQGYYKYMFDLVNAVDDPGSTRNYDNSGTGYVLGGELMLRANFTDRFFGWVSYSISKSMRTDGPGTSERPFDMDQRHNLIAVASYQFPKGWRLGGRFQFTSGEPYTELTGSIYNADNGTYLPMYDADNVNGSNRSPYHRLDIRLDKEWLFNNWVLHTYLDVQNVYLQKNPIATISNYDFSEKVHMTNIPILPSIGVSAEF